MNILGMGRDMLAKVAKDWFTGLDGESYAIGKALAVFMTIMGAPLPYLVLIRTGELSLTEAGLFFGGLGGAVMALVWGTHPVEPKGPAEESKP